jgi:flagellar biosynthesis protein FlhB
VGAGLLASGPAGEDALAVAARLLAASARAAASLDPEVGGAAADALWAAARLAAIPTAAAAAAALAAGLAQTGGLLSPGAPRWRGERLDLAAGLRRLAAPDTAAAGSLQATLAIGALGVAALVLAGLAPALAAAPRLGAGGAGAALAGVARSSALPLLAALAAAGAADLLLARRRLARSLRMTRAEVERDLREEEGDPWTRAERRRRDAEPSPAGPPPPAACVVVNPTRIAVTLGHRRGSDEAPVVLDKRAGPAAAALRRRARRAGLPVVRDPALARALWSLAEIGQSIPEELYDAAAALLASLCAPGWEGRR